MNKSIVILGVALLFHLLMWKSGLGWNAMLFSLAITGAASQLKPAAFARWEVKALLGAWCYAGLCVVVHHSELSIAAYWFLCFVCIGYLQSERVHFWVFGVLESIRALFGGWFIALRHQLDNLNNVPKLWEPLRHARLLAIPLVVAVPFFLLYSQGSAAFGDFSEWLGTQLGHLLTFELDGFRLLFFVVGWVLALALLGHRLGMKQLHDTSAQWPYELDRRTIRQRSRFDFIGPLPTLGLQREYQTALLTFGTLNALLLVINALDIKEVWLFSGERTAAELSQFVHAGTWSLITAIILAMAVVLFFLRGNLNFFPNNRFLRQLVYAWLAQNAFLAMSVGIRNGHYIAQYDLAEGRVVVGFFLLLVGFGLYSMYQKVAQRKTAFYLVQVNAVAVGLALLIASSFNWDGFITRYNLSHGNTDSHYLQYRLQNNLGPLLAFAESGTPSEITLTSLTFRMNRIERAYNEMDWRSWNWSVYRQYQAMQPYRAYWDTE